MNQTEFRQELTKIMPGYNWTVHHGINNKRLSATGIQSSGFNRLSTLKVIRIEQEGFARYEVKSRGFGTKTPWAHTNADRTLASALRGLQDHYERQADHFRALAACLQGARPSPRRKQTIAATGQG